MLGLLPIIISPTANSKGSCIFEVVTIVNVRLSVPGIGKLPLTVISCDSKVNSLCIMVSPGVTFGAK